MIIKGMLRKIVDPPLSIQELHKALHNFILARSKGLRSEEHTSELQSRSDLVCRLLLEKKKIHRHLYVLRKPTDTDGLNQVRQRRLLALALKCLSQHLVGPQRPIATSGQVAVRIERQRS